MSATATPTRLSGSARRRAKAIARRSWVVDMDVRQAVEQDRIPRSAIAVSRCSCGRTSWLLSGATDEERASFDRDSDDHGDSCEAWR